MIYQRADAGKDNMGLTTWKDAPNGKIQKFDVVVAKNYLTEHEMAQLSRLVNAYLDVAEDMAKDGKLASVDATLRLAFTWSGFDENDPVSGCGWFTATGDQAEGRIFINLGDESGFTGERAG